MSYYPDKGPDVAGLQWAEKLRITSEVCDSPVCVSLSNVFIQMVLKNTDNILPPLESCDDQLWILRKSSTATGQKCTSLRTRSDKEHGSGVHSGLDRTEGNNHLKFVSEEPIGLGR